MNRRGSIKVIAEVAVPRGKSVQEFRTDHNQGKEMRPTRKRRISGHHLIKVSALISVHAISEALTRMRNKNNAREMRIHLNEFCE